ncbi:MAG: hypothetical protein J0I29_12675 [Rhizobiales bacterium]|nr:hypothetical protein [Hyphomicrobiales bacterium]
MKFISRGAGRQIACSFAAAFLVVLVQTPTQLSAEERSITVVPSTTIAPSVNDAQSTAAGQGAVSATVTAPASACDAHKFIDPDDMVGFMVTDLNKVIKSRQSTQRYLTLTHLANLCVGEDAMKVYRQAAIKLLNSLSRTPDAVKLEAIDPEGTILRFNLVDLGWSLDDWNFLLASYPYTASPDSELSRTLAKTTSTTLPYVRADWLASNATQPQLYYSLMKLPNRFQDFAQQQGIDVAGDIRNLTAQRAGFEKSNVTQNNRIVERHPSRTGYFWVTYDFAGGKDRQSIFDFPTGPGGGNGFSHDSSETFFSLPNGFQGYYLSKASGERLDRSLPGVARDQSQRIVTVTRGISCMSCSDAGLERAKDEVRNLVLSGRTFPREVRDVVDGLYPPQEKMDALLDDDVKRFSNAMSRAGLDPDLRLNGLEMMTAMSGSYDGDLDLRTVAAELGLTISDFNESVDEAAGKFRPLLRRLTQGKISRDEFERSYRDLADGLTDLALLPVQNKAKALAVQGQGAQYVAPPVQAQKQPYQPPRPQYQPPRPTYQRGY